MKVLVTGATGFVGKYLVKALLKENYEVRCLVRRTSNIEFLKKLNVELVYGDVLDKKSLVKALDKIDLVYHLVGIGDITSTSEEAYKNYYTTNVLGTKNLLDSIKTKKTRIIYFSSTAAMGVIDGLSDEKTKSKAFTAYERSKNESEKLLVEYHTKYGVPIIILRPSMIFGPGDKHNIIDLTVKIMERGFFFMPGNGKNRTGLVFVEDVIQAAVNAAKIKKEFEVYILTNRISFNELINLISKCIGKSVKIIHLPVFLSKFGVFFIESFYRIINKTPIITLKRLDSILADRIYDTSKSEKDLKFKNTNLEKALEQTLRWKK